jgi:hypothetical protein
MALWTPALISTALWLDAADSGTITLDGSLVSEWRDKSGNARHASETGTNRPSIESAAVNGLDVVDFTTANRFLTFSSALSVTTAMTVFEVFGRASSGILSMPLGGTTAGGPPYGLQWFTDNVRYSGLGSTGFSTHGTASTATGTMLSALWRNASNVTLAVNGSQVGTAQAALTLTSANFGYIGRRASDYHSGRILEIIAVASTLSTEDRQIVEGYLAHKWGLTGSLPSDHPYKTTAPQSYSVSGIVTDAAGDPVARIVRAYSRSTGELLAETTSDAVTGFYEIALPTDDEIQRVVLDSATTDPLYNDLIDRVIPQ